MKMNKISREATTVLLIMLASIAILGLVALFPATIGIGAPSQQIYRYLYFNTYNYPNLTQQAATVYYTYNNSLSVTSGECFTNVMLFSIPSILELDAPINGATPVYQQYSNNFYGNIAQCEIQLPVSNYNATTGSLVFYAIGNNGAKSNQYSTIISVESAYEAQTNPSSQKALIITIPLVNTNSQTTTITTITSTSTVPTTSTTTLQSSSSTTTTPTTTVSQVNQTQTIIPQTTNTISQKCTTNCNNISIWQEIINFFNSILKFLTSSV
jgi:hypothetical protein